MATFSPVPVGTEFRVNATTAGDQDRPTAIGLGDGGFMATWHVASAPRDLYAQRFDASGNAVGAEIHISAPEDSTQIVATADGGFVKVWEEGGADPEIFAQLYNSDGTVNGSAFFVGNGDLRPILAPSSVAGLAEGGFVVTWFDGSDSVNAALVPADSTVPVAFATDVVGSTSSVRTLSDGGFVIFALNADYDHGEAQRFDSTGQAVTVGLNLPSYFVGDPFFVDAPVAEMENGGFVAVASGSSGVYAYVQGAPEGNGQFRIVEGSASEPTIAALPDGGFLVTWERFADADGDGAGVYGQRFDAAFNPLGDEIPINTFTIGNQLESAIAVLGDGSVVTLWMSEGQDGDSGGIYAQRFDLPDIDEGVRVYTDDDDLIEIPDGTELQGVDGAGGRDTLIVTASHIDMSVGDGNRPLFEADGIGGAPADGTVDRTWTAQNVEIVEIHTKEATISGDFSTTDLDPVEITYVGDADANVVDATALAATGRLIAFGNGGDDLLIAGAGADQMIGGTGIDTVSYDAAGRAVTVSLLSGNVAGSYALGDTFSGVENLIGSDYDDVLEGDAGANRLDGGYGRNTLHGDAGDDVLTGHLLADTFDGGTGSDTVDYSASSARVIVDLQTGLGSGGHANGDVLSGVENIVGSAYRDRLVGDGGANRLEGGDGNDTLLGDAGADILIGGNGSDTLYGDAGADVLTGGTGIDAAIYLDSDAGVIVSLESGNTAGGHAQGDSLSGIEYLTGSGYGDFLKGDAGANRLHGDAGDDLLEGGAGADVIDGGTGIDTARYRGSAEAVTVDLASGYAAGGDAAGDYIDGIENILGSLYGDLLIGDEADNRLDGDAGADRLQGFAGDDVLIGGAGDDILQGGQDADVLNGGAGIDTASYDDGYFVTISLETGTTFGYAAGDTFFGIENLRGSDEGDFLKGDAGTNRLEGGGGDDLLEGGAGGDTLVGGAGIDTARYAGSGAGVTISLLTGNAVGGHAGGDTFSGIEDLIGSAFADFLKGDAGGNRLEGGTGNDRLEGEAGNDVLMGGYGADRLDGGAGSDWADYSGSAAGVTVSLLTGNAVGGHAAGDTFIGIENLKGSAYADFLKGDAGSNRLEGGGGDDRLEGEGGNDRLEGGDGDDILEGGAGADTLLGGAGIDTASYAGSTAVFVSLRTGTIFGGDAQGDTLTGIENLLGSSFADYLAGTTGTNRLEGGGGDDKLEGDAGNDVLVGGTGDDIFIFGDGFGNDTVIDFAAGAGTDDRLDFSAHGILNSYAAVMAGASQQGADTVIDIGSDKITLIGVDRADLHQDDFLF